MKGPSRSGCPPRGWNCRPCRTPWRNAAATTWSPASAWGLPHPGGPQGRRGGRYGGGARPRDRPPRVRLRPPAQGQGRRGRRLERRPPPGPGSYDYCFFDVWAEIQEPSGTRTPPAPPSCPSWRPAPEPRSGANRSTTASAPPSGPCRAGARMRGPGASGHDLLPVRPRDRQSPGRPMPSLLPHGLERQPSHRVAALTGAVPGSARAPAG